MLDAELLLRPNAGTLQSTHAVSLASVRTSQRTCQSGNDGRRSVTHTSGVSLTYCIKFREIITEVFFHGG
jgi:hypothetical protein